MITNYVMRATIKTPGHDPVVRYIRNENYLSIALKPCLFEATLFPDDQPFARHLMGCLVEELRPAHLSFKCNVKDLTVGAPEVLVDLELVELKGESLETIKAEVVYKIVDWKL